MMDRDTRKSRGFGFVTFEEPRDAEDAVKFARENSLVVDGRPVRVDYATPVGEAVRCHPARLTRSAPTLTHATQHSRPPEVGGDTIEIDTTEGRRGIEEARGTLGRLGAGTEGMGGDPIIGATIGVSHIAGTGEGHPSSLEVTGMITVEGTREIVSQGTTEAGGGHKGGHKDRTLAILSVCHCHRPVFRRY